MASTSIAPITELDGDPLYEVVNGEIVQIASMGVYETWIASLIIQHFASQQGYGRAVVEALFDFSGTLGKKRRPDLAFVSFERWPRERQVPRTEAWDVVPNLVVEVVSPTNPANEVVDKIADFFQVGVERAWVIYPSQRQIYVYSSPTDVCVLTADNELTDDALLPGFRLPLKELFDDTATSGA